MSLTPFTPIDRLFDRALANFFHDLDGFHRNYTPYWIGKRLTHDFGKDEVSLTDKSFDVAVDVSSFHPNELQVAVENNQLIVRGTHEQTTEHSSVKRHFERRYTLPENIDETQLKSALTEDGKLKIEAPVKNAQIAASRSIPIEMAKK